MLRSLEAMHAIRTSLLLGATMSMGLMAGVFALYAHTIMPGLRRTDDRTFVDAFQALDRAIINPWFMMSTFGGGLVFTALAALAQFGRPGHGWTLAALALYVIAVVITIVVNVPANDAIKAAGAVDGISDLAAVRRQFDEARWRAWNMVRVVTSIGAFGSLCWALLIHGQSGSK